jgi:hypothetical protein
MDKLESHISKEAAWRGRLQRHAQSGKSVAAFCQDEAVSTASFYLWRSKLVAADGRGTEPARPVDFIDLGAVKNTLGVNATAHAAAPASNPGIDVRIELGGGIVLTITRR